MSEHPYRQEHEDIRELLRQFENLRTGRGHTFLNEESFERIIDHFDDMDDIPRAIEAAEEGIRQYPYSSSLLIKKADLLIATRQYQQSLDLLAKAEILDSTDIDIYILRTDAFLALDQHEKAASLLEEAIDQFEGEDRLNLLFELADVYDDYEEFDKVFDCLRMILEYDPNNEEALYKICFWTDFTGRNEESIRLHQQIIDEYPYNELAWFNLAAAYQGLRLYEKSIDAYKYALVINEKFDYAYRNMADAYIRLRKYRDAIEALEKVVELARPEDVIYEAIGHCYEKLRNPAQARFYYRKASHLNPEDARLLHRVASTYMQESNWAQAAKYLEMALRISRNQVDYTLDMGECMMHLNREKDAIQYFSAAVQSKPRHAGAREALIRALLAGGYLEEAEKQVQLALQATHDKPVFLFYKTAVLFAAGRSREALLVMEEAMTKAPRLLKKLMDLDPSLLRYQQVVDLVARFKRNKSI